MDYNNITSVFTLILINIVTVSALCVTRSTKKTENHHGHQIRKTPCIFATIRKQDAKKQKILPQNGAKIWPKLRNPNAPLPLVIKGQFFVIFGAVL